jgi:hypothetical protein
MCMGLNTNQPPVCLNVALFSLGEIQLSGADAVRLISDVIVYLILLM